MMTRSPDNRRWLQFGISTLLTLTCLIAVYLGGRVSHKYGYQQGYRDGRIAPMDDHSIYELEYDVGDLIGPIAGDTPESDRIHSELVKSVTTRVAPSTWDFVGGYATIQPDKSRESLVVEHTVSGHAEITQFLSRVREQKEISGEIDATKVLRQLSDQDEKND